MLFVQQLQESEGRYRRLFEHSNDAILLIDPETTQILDCNRKVLEMNGYSYDELTSMTIPELHPPHEREALPTAFETVLQTGFIDHYTGVHHQRKDGGWVPIEVNPALIEVGGKKVIRGIAGRDRAPT